MFRITNFLMALSFGTQRAQLVQRTALTWPRLCLQRPPLRPPAPLAYIKIVAVKTFEVYSCPTRVLLLYDGSRSLDCCDYKTGCARRPRGRRGRSVALMPFIGCSVSASPAAITLNKLECSKQAILRPRIILHGIMEYDLGLNIHWFVIRSRGND